MTEKNFPRGILFKERVAVLSDNDADQLYSDFVVLMGQESEVTGTLDFLLERRAMFKRMFVLVHGLSKP